MNTATRKTFVVALKTNKKQLTDNFNETTLTAEEVKNNIMTKVDFINIGVGMVIGKTTIQGSVVLKRLMKMTNT